MNFRPDQNKIIFLKKEELRTSLTQEMKWREQVREIPEYTKKSQLGDDDSVTQRNSGPALVNL